MIQQLTALFDKAKRDEEGVAGLEFAMTAPVLSIMLLGAAEYGLMVQERTTMTSSVNAGIRYYLVGGEDSARAEAAALANWHNRPENASVRVEEYCECQQVEHACSANCPDDSLPTYYSRITASVTYEGIFMNTVLESSDDVRVR